MELLTWTVAGLLSVTFLTALARLAVAVVRVKRLGGFSPCGIPTGWFHPDTVEGRLVWWGRLDEPQLWAPHPDTRR